MGLVFEADELGRSRFVLRDEPDFIVPLEIAPPALENFLSSGKWLVVGVSVWSSHDMKAAGQAMRLIKAFHGFVKLGLRPVDNPNENLPWIPRLVTIAPDSVEVSARWDDGACSIKIQSNTSASPVWVSLSDGELIDLRHGLLDRVEITKILDRLLAA
jgi:hypothetical protein